MPIARLNHAVLFVREWRAAAFYRSLRLRGDGAARRMRAAFMRSPTGGDHHDLGLFEVGPVPRSRARFGGPLHLAWQIDTIEQLAETAKNLPSWRRPAPATRRKQVPVRARPDGNEFEVMWQVPQEAWGEFAEQATIMPLDLDAEVARWGREPPSSSRRSALGAPVQRVEVGDDQLLVLEAQDAVVDELGQQPVHALPRTADHRRQVGLGVGPVQLDRSRVAPGCAWRPSRQASGQAARQVQEMQLLDVLGEPSQLSGQSGEERVAQLRVLLHELAEDSRGRLSVSLGSSAVAVAERGRPSSSASSPKKSPGRSVAMIASSPSAEGSTILTAPLATMCSESPGSP